MKKKSLKNFFADFLRSRHELRHFRRLILLGSFNTASGSRDLPEKIKKSLADAAGRDTTELLQDMGSSLQGLSEKQSDNIREKSGYNDIQYEKPLPWFKHLWLCYRNPFNLLLTVLALVSFCTGDYEAVVVIVAMVVLATVLRFWQEAKSNKAADKLREMVRVTATVIRPLTKAQQKEAAGLRVQKYREEIPVGLLVPGDVVALSAGDMIPADCRLLSGKDVFVAQASMTGESLPVEKFFHKTDAGSNPLQADNLLFMGTNVVSGTATALVLHTGDDTYFGSLARSVTRSSREPTAFQLGVNKVSWLLIRFMLVMVPIVLLLNGFTKGDWPQALLFALSVAVGLTPEMLPMIVTSTLAKGAVFLSRKKVIVKRLDAVQNLGAMDVLCTDKTGTLTQDKIYLARHTDAFGRQSLSVLEAAYLNSSCQTGLKNLLDAAVTEFAAQNGGTDAAGNFTKTDELPFDFSRRRMSVAFKDHSGSQLLITKGAVEEMLAVCDTVRDKETLLPLAGAVRAKVLETADEMNRDGLRVIAVATRDFSVDKEAYRTEDESGMTLIGLVAFFDPPKESARQALVALKAHGVAVKVLTGDNESVTRKVCREVGFDDSEVITGDAVEAMADEALKKAVAEHHIFAKLTPAHKERIVSVLKASGHTVGFLGDGINDAPALRSADVGISVDTAVDIAKEAADMILLEKSLMVLEDGILEGRRTFINMLKYIKMTASSNFGNVFSVLVAGVFIPFLPMLPLQLLLQNMLYDISQIAIPFDKVDEEQLAQPQKWQPRDIGRFMVFFGPISSIFDILTFAMMWFVFAANSVANEGLFQTGWFVVGLLTQTLIVHMIRTEKVPFLQSTAALPLLVMTGIIMVVGIALPMSAAGAWFDFVPLPGLYFVFLPFILLGYMLLTQALKKVYCRRWGWQ